MVLGLANQAKFSALFGLAATLLFDLGDVVWWFKDVVWKLGLAFYYNISFVISTVVFCRFSTDRER